MPDVRPFYEEADIAIVPLLTARGIQNKLLEAMAMAIPVVASSAAFTGLDPQAGALVPVADEPAAWVAALDALLREPARRRSLGEQARRFVCARYGWARQGRRLVDMLTHLAKADPQRKACP